MLKNRPMVLSFDDHRKLAAVYDIFVRVDARRKAARRSRKKSKPNEEIKPRSSDGLRGFCFLDFCSIYSILIAM